MICSNCPGNCGTCQSPNCCCQHTKAQVRPLTSRERHEYMIGLRDRYLIPRNQPDVTVTPFVPAGTNGAH